MSNHGKIWWSELNTWDPEESVAYYEKVAGWKFDAMDMPEGRKYYLAMMDGQPMAGIFTMHKPEFEGIPNHWFTYIAVANMEKTLSENAAAGGAVKREPFTMPGTGTIAIITDSTGAAVGIIEPDTGNAA